MHILYIIISSIICVSILYLILKKSFTFKFNSNIFLKGEVPLYFLTIVSGEYKKTTNLELLEKELEEKIKIILKKNFQLMDHGNYLEATTQEIIRFYEKKDIRITSLEIKKRS